MQITTDELRRMKNQESCKRVKKEGGRVPAGKDI